MGGARRAVEAVKEFLWPARCVGCDELGTLLCGRCRARLAWIEQRHACPVCGAPYGWLACTDCRGGWETDGCVSACVFDGPAARMVTVYKDETERRLAGVLAALVSTAIDEAAGWPGRGWDLGRIDAVCFVPATWEAYRRRGFDHMEDVARGVAAEFGLDVADVLARRKAADQRRLGREERAANVAGTVEVMDDVSGARLLLLDDVITTGASIREAAGALKRRGAAGVWAASALRTW